MSETTLNDKMQANFLLIEIMKTKWSINKSNPSVAEQAAMNAGAAKGVFKVTQNIMKGYDTEIKDIYRQQSAVSTYVRKNTQPYSTSSDSSDNKGRRLMHTTRAMEIQVEANRLIAEHDAMVHELFKTFDNTVQLALAKQGSEADASLYPTAQEVANKFTVSMEITRVPDMGRDMSHVNVSAELAQAYGEDIKNQQQRIVINAMKDLEKETIKALETMEAQMYNKAKEVKGTKVFESTVEHIQTATTMVEHGNLTNDPRMEKLLPLLKVLARTNMEVAKVDPVYAEKVERVTHKALLILEPNRPLYVPVVKHKKKTEVINVVPQVATPVAPKPEVITPPPVFAQDIDDVEFF